MRFCFFALGALGAASAIASSPDNYTLPSSKGLRIQHGFETILVQPFGYDGIRVRAWPFRPPSGQEVSFVYDPPLEGPEDGQARGMSFDTMNTGNNSAEIRNGNILVKTSGWGGSPGGYRLNFYRLEDDGTETLLTGEYAPLKSLNPRYYSWNGPGSEFSAEFSFSTTPDEQIYVSSERYSSPLGGLLDLLPLPKAQSPTDNLYSRALVLNKIICSTKKGR